MEDEYCEKTAQLQYENFKLNEELTLLNKHATSLEESYNSLSSTCIEKENHIKCLDQKLYEIFEVLKEKEALIESLDTDNEKYLKLNTDLLAEVSALKESKIETQDLFEKKKEELLESLMKLEEENKELMFELTLKSEEIKCREITLKDLLLRNKELEDEKLELLAMKDHLLYRCNEKKGIKLEPSEGLLSRHDYNMNRSEGTIFEQNAFPNNSQCLNLKEEILEVEIEEKTNLIDHLKCLLVKKEEEKDAVLKLLNELERRMESGGLLVSNERLDFNFDSPLFFDIRNILLQLIAW